MNLKTGNAVIRRAREEKRKSDKLAHAFQPSYNQPLGYHVETVFMAVTGDAFRLPPFNSELGRCNDAGRCLEIILSTAEPNDPR